MFDHDQSALKPQRRSKEIRFNYQLRATLGGTCTPLGSDPVSNMTHLSRLARDIACRKKGAAIMLYLLMPSLWEIDRVSKREVDQSASCWRLPHQRVSKLQYLFQQNQKRSWYYENRCTQLRFVLGYRGKSAINPLEVDKIVQSKLHRLLGKNYPRWKVLFVNGVQP